MIGRREFIAGLGGAAAWPFAVCAQQRDLPVIGFLHAASVESYVASAAGFAQGLSDAGFAEANLAIEYRFANGQPGQLATLAADLVRRQVDVIVVGGDARAAIAANAATASISIVFVLGSDPVRLGLAASLDRPGGNTTGVTFTTTGLVDQKLTLLHELNPGLTSVGYLAEDPRAYISDIEIARAIETQKNEMLAAAGARGWPVIVAEIGGDHDYEAAFAMLADRRAGALVVAPSAVFANDADDVTALAIRHEIPTVWPRRADVVAGGLMSYGARQADAWRHGGRYAGQILKGAVPAEMPVVRSTTLELVISRGIAKSLGLMVPPALFARADEVMD
jgi:putative tryptophan/tyrosine transport system substrate-binding protein